MRRHRRAVVFNARIVDKQADVTAEGRPSPQTEPEGDMPMLRPEPTPVKPWCRGLLILAACGLLASLPIAFAGESPGKRLLTQEEISAMVKRVPLTEDSRREHRERIEGLKEKLREARQGKRDDSDRLAILYRLYMAHFALSEDLTPEARAYRAEGEELLRKHPEFKTNFPFDLREEREGRERRKRIAAQREASLAGKIKTFKPRDATAKVFWDGDNLMAIHQRRIDFYKLPKGVECIVEYGGGQPVRTLRFNGRAAQGETSSLSFRRGKDAVDLKPFKRITFGQALVFPSFVGSPAGCDKTAEHCRTVAVAAYGHGYGASDGDEYEALLRLNEIGRPFHWTDAKADFQEFYGVVSIDGKVLGQVPFKANWPDIVLSPLYVYEDGTAIFGIGRFAPVEKAEECPDGRCERFGKIREVLVWSPRAGVRRMPLVEAEREFPGFSSMWGLQWLRE